MFEEFIRRKKPIPYKLLSYGFTKEGDVFRYSTGILNGAFALTVLIDSDNTIKTDLVDKETGEVYVLYKTDAAGSYVGEIRFAVQQIICDISQMCYESSIFKTTQAQMAIEFVREVYGDELEFLWTKFPDNAVWRRKDNKKWYGAVLTVAGRKIGLQSDKIEEIIDLRMEPSEADRILSKEHYYPGWHMNKKSWYTVVLNESISDDELKERIKESYELAGKR